MTQRDYLAIVGYAYRAPGVGRKGLWQFLKEGRSAWSPVPSDRFSEAGNYHPSSEKPGFIHSKGAHFLPDDIYAFDPSFFKISAEEARSMDPQHRILLECAFEAAENAGIPLPALLGSKTGVFSAGVESEYNIQMAEDMPTSSKYMALGIAPNMFANRLSYFFGLTGPSITVDAACASSSYAVHLACQSVLAGDCSAAFVGGSKLLNGTTQWSGLDTMGTLSSEGKCFSYDTRASGFGKGEGAACIIIKRLSDALACGDSIRAVILNSACNHSGRTQGISMPSRPGQEELLLTLHSDIGLQPHETTFVEGHGTGTPVGDPIDASAIASVIAKGRPPSEPVYLGSIKPNLGHLEGASGMMSIIKCVMMLERGIMLPNANFLEMNPEIQDGDRLLVLPKATQWPSRALKRTCVTNYGFGGSNAAILLEEAPVAGMANGQPVTNGHLDEDIDEHLFVFSAQSMPSLENYLSSFIEYLDGVSDSSSAVKDVAFTLGQRRTHFAHRIAIPADSILALKEQLKPVSKVRRFGQKTSSSIAFTFTGQGAQYFQMAAGLRKYSEFANTVDAIESFLSGLGATWSLKEELSKCEKESRVNDAEISQPACTAIQLGLVALLRSWGVMPAVVIGHSSGEIAAAYAAGLISFEAAIAIALFRGIAARKVHENKDIKGGMLAIGATHEEAQSFVDNAKGYACIAAVNSLNSVTISGDVEAIQEIQKEAEKQSCFVRRLKVGVAYHSKHMDTASDTYLAAIEPYCSSCPPSDNQNKPRFVSSVTGKQETELEASYWVRNLLQPVQYLSAAQKALSGNESDPITIVEIGPHSALQGPTKNIIDKLATKNQSTVTYLPSLVRGKRAATALLNLAGTLFAMGSELDLAAINLTKLSQVQVVKDLPAYSWNKSSRYIHQPRVAANKLFNGSPYNKLLGWKSPYSEGNDVAFRNVFTLDDLPWVRDHVVAGDILFPFTGFLSLAIEGFRTLNPKLAPAVVIREFHVTTSLVIVEDQKVDITTKFRPEITGTETVSSTAWAFDISTWTESHGWTRHSYGIIEGDHSHETLSSSPDVLFGAALLEDKTLKRCITEEVYKYLKTHGGLNYGPTFRNMLDLWEGAGAAVQTIALRQLELEGHAHPEASPVTVDPPTLDTIFHSLGALQGGVKDTIVPTYCQRWRISNHIPADTGRKFSVIGKVVSRDVKSGATQMHFVIFDASTQEPVADIGPVKLQCIARADTSSQTFPDSYAIKHVPYVDLMDPKIVAEMIVSGLDPVDKAEIQHRRDLDQVTIYYLDRMIKETAEDDLSGIPTHRKKFLVWAKRAVSAQKDPIPISLVEEMASANDTGKMVNAVGKQLPQIIRGEQEPLEIMLEDNLLQRTYEQYNGCNRVNEAAAKYIARLAEINPELSILEIGAGTASATLPILNEITRATKGAAPHFHFTFTDISAGFFDNARIKLSKWAEHITYQKLDICQDPLSQGFQPDAFDVIVSSNCLHATPDIVETLKNAKSLLKPNGKLVLMEAVVEVPPHFLPFVLLDGWWLSQDPFRSQSDGPLLTQTLWDEVLKVSGYSGVDALVDDYPGEPEHLFSAMWATKCDTQGASRKKDAPPSVMVCYSSSEDTSIEFASELSNVLADQLGGTSTAKHLLDHEENDNVSNYVVLDSPGRSMLTDLSSDMFHRIKELLLHATLLWILPDNSHPDAAIITGILRSLRIETTSSKLVLLEAPYDKDGAAAISRVLERVILDPNSAVKDEQEYSLIDNIIHVPRLTLVDEPKETFIAETGGSVKSEQNIWHENAAIEMTVDTVGSPDSVYFRHSDILSTTLGDDEVIIRVDAIGMNFRDLLLVLGSMPWHPPGLEGAGVVERVGSRVQDLIVGDRVFYVCHEAGMANFVRLPSLRVHKLPEGLATADAASMPVTYSTAMVALTELGRLRKGESVLIHSASGAVGQSCILLAQHIGARIFATAGSTEKREFVANTFGIPMAQVFSSRNSAFKDGILKATNGKGVDVIVNSLSDNLLQHTWDLIAENGRFIEIGKKDLLANNYLPMRHFDKNVTFSAIDLRKIAAARPEAVNEWLSNIVRLFEAGKITPIRPVNRVPISELKTGLRKLQGGQNIGKIVVTTGPDEIVVVERPSPFKTRSGSLFNPDGTYLITGGTGGLGRALAKWMIKKGAKNLVLLGRSNPFNAKAMELVQQYEGTDISVRAVACDVGSREDLTRIAEEIQTLPKVRGIIHGALYLRDSIFVNATYEDWEQVMGPKVKGAWNLHELFTELDFFVSLSSMTGVIGRTGTSLYAGTSTFLDAFAEYRVKLGLPAVAVDLPVVEDVGLAVERGTIDQLTTSLGVTITEDQFYILIEGAIMGPSSGLNAGGRSMTWTLASKAKVDHLGWEHFNPLSVMRRSRTEPSGGRTTSDGGKNLQNLAKSGSPEALMDALSEKVSSITMIDQDEITPNRSLLDYGLDSLFSLELRNWIRRTLDVNMALKDITSAKDLKSLVDQILLLMKSTGTNTAAPESKGKIEAGAAAVSDSETSSKTSSQPVSSERPPSTPVSPFQRLIDSGVKEEELESLQKHLQSIGIGDSDVESVLPCTHVQEGILFAQLKDKQEWQYWECLTLKIVPEGSNDRVNVDQVAAAWKALCNAQPMLRTVFVPSPLSVGAFHQVILKDCDPYISFATVGSGASLKAVLKTMPELHFAAAQPPHHVHITQESDTLIYASFYMNHTLFDDRSFRLIGQQLRQAYADLSSIPKGLDVGKYISWVRGHPESAKDYWKEYLSGTQQCFISVLEPFESNLLDKTALPYVDVSINQASLLHPFSRQHGVTVANIVQVAWGLVLSRCIGSHCVTFGCGQSQIGAVEGAEVTLGPLLANMICRFDVTPETTVLDLLKNAREDSLRALELPSCSMAELHEAIGLGQSSLFDTAMTIVRFPPENATKADGIQVEFLAPDENPTEYAVTLGVGYDNDRVLARLWYDNNRVSRSLATQLGPLFSELVSKIVAEPNLSIAALESSIHIITAAFSAKDVARSVYREAAAQCELPASAVEELYPCSRSQQDQIQASLQENNGGFTDQYVFQISKDVSADRLYDALDAVAAAIPTLRTRFVSLKKGGICQVTVKSTPAWSSESSLADYLQWDRDFRIRYGGPLCRFGDVEQGNGEKYFILSLHPALYDPWTLDVILAAVKKTYDGETLAPLQPFSAHICRLPGRKNIQTTKNDFQKALPKWSQDTYLQFPRVPTGVPEPNISSTSSLDLEMAIPDPAVLCAAWALCLSRLRGDGKTSFGVHLDGRSTPGAVDSMANILGPLGATMPFAIDTTTTSTGDELVEVVREHGKAAAPYIHASNSSETSPVFRNVLVIHDNGSQSSEVMDLTQTNPSKSSFRGARLITRCKTRSSGLWYIQMQFDNQVISSEDIDVLMHQYKHAITQLVSKGSVSLRSLTPLSQYERSLMLEFNANCPEGIDACIQGQIRDVAKGQPGVGAVCSWDCVLDYAQLDDLSDRFAVLLQNNGVGAGTMVPYMVEKSAAAMVVMLGILKSGGVLVALDLDHPAQRLSTIMAAVGASTIITSPALSEKAKAKVSAKTTVVVDIDIIRSLPQGRPESVSIQSSDPCYIIYTSGSTGMPKGVVVSHSNLVTNLHHNRELLGMSPSSRTLQFSNFIFDASIYEIFMTLVSGGCVCVPQESERLNNLSAAIQRMRANYTFLTPSTASLLNPAEVPTLRTLVLAGEPFPRNMMDKWKHVRLINAYGPSEVTVCSSRCIVTPNSGKHHLNIGRPVSCRYWVVDPSDHDKLVPIGCPGELLVQGPIVAQGYLGNPEKTASAFIEPATWTWGFASLNLLSQRWYKTGDLVVQTADGSAVYHGRKGTQVKLAGQRIELEEIEHHLRRLSDPTSKIAVEMFLQPGDEQDPCLAAFYAVTENDGESKNVGCDVLPPDPEHASKMRQLLRTALPAYMVPKYFFALSKMPLAGWNKTDRALLRKLSTNVPREQLSKYSGMTGGPTQEDEQKRAQMDKQKVDKNAKDAVAVLQKLWARVLSLQPNRIQASDDFFVLGGSSIRAMRLVNTARRAGYALTVTDVFSKPMLSNMAVAMRPAVSAPVVNGNGSLVKSERASSSSLNVKSSLKACLSRVGLAVENVESAAKATDAQADMAALTELDGDGFYPTITLEAKDGLDTAKIVQACAKVIRHHPLLRTVFVQHGSALEQVVLETLPRETVVVVTSESEEEIEVFGDRLPQFCLITTGDRVHKLSLRIRHALYDALYLPTILQDLRAAYIGESLSNTPSFHGWLSHVQSLDATPARHFWQQALRGSTMTYVVPPKNLPTSGSALRDEITMRVPLPATHHGTPASVVHAVWALVLSRFTNSTDVIFGAPNANRNANFPDVDRVPGPCLNHLPVRARLNSATTLGDLVAQIQKQAVSALPHQHLGFRDIIRDCTDWPDWTRLSSVVLFQNHESALTLGGTVDFGDVQCKIDGHGSIGQASDIWLVVQPEGDELAVHMFYSKNTMADEKAQWTAGFFRTVLEAAPEMLELPIDRVGEGMTVPVVDEDLATAPHQNGHKEIGKSRAPTKQTFTVVSQVWDEVGLRKMDKDNTMFDCGADLVSTMLLSRAYQRRGFAVSMQNVIDRPTQQSQAEMLESLGGACDETVVNGHH